MPVLATLYSQVFDACQDLAPADARRPVIAAINTTDAPLGRVVTREDVARRSWFPILVRPVDSSSAAAEAVNVLHDRLLTFASENLQVASGPAVVDLADGSVLMLFRTRIPVQPVWDVHVEQALAALARMFDTPLAWIDHEATADAAARFPLILDGGAAVTSVVRHEVAPDAPLMEPAVLARICLAGGIDGDELQALVDARVAEVRAAAVEDEPDPVNSPRHLALSLINARFSHPDGPTLRVWGQGWYRWRDGGWAECDAVSIQDALAQHAEAEFQRDARERRAAAAAGPRQASISESKRVVIHPYVLSRGLRDNAMISLRANCLVEDSVATTPAWLGPDAASRPNPLYCLSTPTGVLDLNRMGDSAPGSPVPVIPATPNFFTTAASPVPYDPTATAPTWDAFLADIWPDDPESIRALRQWFGLALVAETRFQKALLIVGKRRGGKGTIFRTLGRLLSASSLVSTTAEDVSGPFGLESLIGRSVCLIPEFKVTAKTDLSSLVTKIKTITGKDDGSIQRKHRAGFRATLGARFLMAANSQPTLTDQSGAIISRLVVLHAPRSFEHRMDTELEDRIALELPGILRWAIEGLRDLLATGAPLQPATGRVRLDEMARLTNATGAFIEDRCVVEPGAVVLRKDLYAAWREWCLEHGRERPGDEATFGRDLHACVTELGSSQIRVNGVRTRAHTGIRLRTEADDAAEVEADLIREFLPIGSNREAS